MLPEDLFTVSVSEFIYFVQSFAVVQIYRPLYLVRENTVEAYSPAVFKGQGHNSGSESKIKVLFLLGLFPQTVLRLQINSILRTDDLALADVYTYLVRTSVDHHDLAEPDVSIVYSPDVALAAGSHQQKCK